jgi:hypothetical protein
MHYNEVGSIPGMQVWLNIHKSINVTFHIQGIKDKSSINTSLGAEKPLTKFNINS